MNARSRNDTFQMGVKSEIYEKEDWPEWRKLRGDVAALSLDMFSEVTEIKKMSRKSTF